MTLRYVQVGLDAMQAEELGRFLSQKPDPNATLELEDHETAGDFITAAWNRSANRLTLTAKVAHWTADPTTVLLMADDASSLASFLNAGSPGPL
jgi:hypothetical protein